MKKSITCLSLLLMSCGGSNNGPSPFYLQPVTDTVVENQEVKVEVEVDNYDTDGDLIPNSLEKKFSMNTNIPNIDKLNIKILEGNLDEIKLTGKNDNLGVSLLKKRIYQGQELTRDLINFSSISSFPSPKYNKDLLINKFNDHKEKKSLLRLTLKVQPVFLPSTISLSNIQYQLISLNTLDFSISKHEDIVIRNNPIVISKKDKTILHKVELELSAQDSHDLITGLKLFKLVPKDFIVSHEEGSFSYIAREKSLKNNSKEVLVINNDLKRYFSKVGDTLISTLNSNNISYSYQNNFFQHINNLRSTVNDINFQTEDNQFTWVNSYDNNAIAYISKSAIDKITTRSNHFSEEKNIKTTSFNSDFKGYIKINADIKDFKTTITNKSFSTTWITKTQDNTRNNNHSTGLIPLSGVQGSWVVNINEGIKNIVGHHCFKVSRSSQINYYCTRNEGRLEISYGLKATPKTCSFQNSSIAPIHRKIQSLTDLQVLKDGYEVSLNSVFRDFYFYQGSIYLNKEKDLNGSTYELRIRNNNRRLEAGIISHNCHSIKKCQYRGSHCHMNEFNSSKTTKSFIMQGRMDVKKIEVL